MVSITSLSPVVQRVDNATQRINHYPEDNFQENVLRHPPDSDLSTDYRYPTFEQPLPDGFLHVYLLNHTVVLNLCKINVTLEDANTSW